MTDRCIGGARKPVRELQEKRLLRLTGVTAELFEVDKTDIEEIRYIITEKGISVRNN